MSLRRSPILWLIAACVVASAAWFVITPRRAWQDFLRSLVQNDYALLQSVTDGPALKENAIADLKVAVAAQAPRPNTPPLREDLMRAMVNTMISPHGLLELVNSFSIPGTGGGPARTAYRYHGLSHVDILLGGTGDTKTGAGLFTFERQGMHWRLIRASSLRIAELTPGS